MIKYRLIGWFILFCTVNIACQSQKSVTSKPNIIFILMDDLGWNNVGFMGSTYYETPNIDSLARNGIIFTSAYSNGPNCAPSRACFLTGQYSPRHGIYTVANSERGKSKLRKIIPVTNKTILYSNAVTIAEMLKPAGYICASIGKWHMGDDPEYGPLAQGFDVNIAGNHNGSPPNGYFAPYKLPYLEQAPQDEYLTDRLTGEAIQFIESHKEKPFFLYLSHYAVHTPLQAPEDLIEKYKKKPDHSGKINPVHAAMLECVDTGIGKIIRELKELQLDDNTVIFFFSDNGGVTWITSMAPLRGGKGMLYEGGIRVPMFVYWPGKIRPGTRCDVPVAGIDFLPTFLELAGIPITDFRSFDGISILPLLQGQQELNREALFWHFPAYLEARNNLPEGARDPYFRTRPAAVIRMGNWKLIEYFEEGDLELYNLKDDLSEKYNMAQQYPDITKNLLNVMQQWRKLTGAPVPSEKNPDYDPVNNDK
jgi:arylsulfatase A-like enzyme